MREVLDGATIRQEIRCDPIASVQSCLSEYLEDGDRHHMIEAASWALVEYLRQTEDGTAQQ